MKWQTKISFNLTAGKYSSQQCLNSKIINFCFTFETVCSRLSEKIVYFPFSAVQARVTKRKRVDAHTTTLKIHVLQVLFCARLKFPVSNHVTLWTNSSCLCPRLKPGKTYLLAGHEDSLSGRFLLNTDTALMTKWKDKWGDRLKVCMIDLCGFQYRFNMFGSGQQIACL